MSKPISTKTLQDARAGFKVLFDGTFNAYNPIWSKIAMEQPSSTAKENYGWLGELPKIREWVGERYIHKLKEHDYSIVNKDFELTIGVARNAIMDDILGTYAFRFKSMGEEAAKHPDHLVFDLLSRGHEELCYDGQPFFDTDHPVETSPGVIESQSNSFTGAGAPWFLMSTGSVVKPIIYQNRAPYQFVSLENPEDQRVFMNKEFTYGVDGRANVGFSMWQLAVRSTKPLDMDSYKEARDALQGRKGRDGKPLGLKADLLVIGQSNETAALEILNADRNEAGATNVYKGTAELFNSPWL